MDFGKEFRDAGTNAYRAGGRVNFQAASSRASSTHDSSERVAAQAAKDAERESMAEMYREQCIQLEDELCRQANRTLFFEKDLAVRRF